MRQDEQDQSKILPNLSPAEWDVMEVFWDHGSMAARDCYARLPEGHGWAVNTLKTLLARLVAKGALEYVQIGNSYLYTAGVARDQMMRQEVEEFRDRVAGREVGVAAVHFLRGAQLTGDDISSLRQLLDEKESEVRRREGTS